MTALSTLMIKTYLKRGLVYTIFVYVLHNDSAKSKRRKWHPTIYVMLTFIIS